MQFFIYLFSYYIIACIYISVQCEAPRVIEGPSNVTSFVDRNLTLMCTTSGRPRPKILWYKRNSTLARYVEIMTKPNSRVKILKNGRLFINRLLGSDTGFYRCSAENNIAAVFSSDAYLTIQAKVTMITGPRSQTVAWGSSVNLTCEVIGIPFPLRSWYKNSHPILDPSTDKIYSRPIYILNATETASYECRAENVHSEGYSIVNKTAVVTVSDSFCDQLESSVCNLKERIFLNSSNSLTIIEDIEMNLKVLFETLPINDNGFCKENAVPIFCTFVFPKCGNLQKPIHLCRESCLAVRDLFCEDWWKVHITSSSLFPLDCNKLTSRYDNTSNCEYIDLFHINQTATTTCLQGNGQYYNGYINVSSSGIKCQPWADQYPHHHIYDPLIYTQLEGSYCRNVGGKKNKPWCFTVNSSVQWQYCDINICLFPERTTTEIYELPIEFNEFWKYFAFIMTFLLIIIIILISIYFVCRRYKKKRSINKSQNILKSSIENIPLNQIPDVLTTGLLSEQRLGILGFEHLEIERNCIEHIDHIAFGAFGQLFKGKFRNKENSTEKIFVVRMLNNEADDYMEGEFIRQAEMLLHLNHHNIIQLMHVCFSGRPLCILVEYMQNKDLCDYLSSLSCQDTSVDFRMKLYIIKQMADVVNYLTSQRIIHRDLAARNFLVSAKDYNTPIIKLSDIGLAVYLNEDDVSFSSDEKELVPIRWTAPEAILYNTFTFASDIWSLGIAIWEVLSNATNPYFELITIEEVSDFVLQRNVLDCPHKMYNEVYDKVLLFCWAFEPQNRLDILTIIQQLNKF